MAPLPLSAPCKVQALCRSARMHHSCRAARPAAADDSGIGVRPRTLDWGGAMDLLQVDDDATLAFEDLVSSHPGNFTAGEQVRAPPAC